MVSPVKDSLSLIPAVVGTSSRDRRDGSELSLILGRLRPTITGCPLRWWPEEIAWFNVSQWRCGGPLCV